MSCGRHGLTPVTRRLISAPIKSRTANIKNTDHFEGNSTFQFRAFACVIHDFPVFDLTLRFLRAAKTTAVEKDRTSTRMTASLMSPARRGRSLSIRIRFRIPLCRISWSFRKTGKQTATSDIGKRRQRCSGYSSHSDFSISKINHYGRMAR